MRFLRVAGVVCCSLLASWGDLSACDCASGPWTAVCQHIGVAPIVFLGESVEIVQKESPFYAYDYRFKVETIYKGLQPGTKEVLIDPDSSTNCGGYYPTGRRFLIFAWPDSDGNLNSGMCSGSRPASELTGEDLIFLKNWLDGRSRTTILGTVQQQPTFARPKLLEGSPVEGASVTLEGEDVTVRQTTDLHGRFRFEVIARRPYFISADLYPYQPSRRIGPITVKEGCCLELFPHLKAQARISGKALQSNGKAAVNQTIRLLRRNQANEWIPGPTFWSSTDKKGRFDFDNLPSGEYLLGHAIEKDGTSHLSPYPPVYFPGVRNRSEARVIHLWPHESVEGLVLSLPPKHRQRRITIEVFGPNGQPTGTNSLDIINGSEPLLRLRSETGRYSFSGYAERAYEFHAVYWVDEGSSRLPRSEQRIAASNRVRLAPGTEPAKVTLTLGNPQRQ